MTEEAQSERFLAIVETLTPWQRALVLALMESVIEEDRRTLH